MAATGERMRALARWLRRTTGLSPMQSVLRGLRKRGIDPHQCSALECFAFTGGMHTLDYSLHVKDLELWEITPAHEPLLRQRFPDAEIRMVDSYEEVRRCQRQFDIIIMDNSPIHGDHVEHYDMFPSIFRLMKPSTVLVVDVIPELNAILRTKYPGMFHEDVRRARSKFYNVNDPDSIPPGLMVETYKRLAAIAGHRLEWYFTLKRNEILSYLVMKFVRTEG